MKYFLILLLLVGFGAKAQTYRVEKIDTATGDAAKVILTARDAQMSAVTIKLHVFLYWNEEPSSVIVYNRSLKNGRFDFAKYLPIGGMLVSDKHGHLLTKDYVYKTGW